jgi:hypothetical protein
MIAINGGISNAIAVNKKDLKTASTLKIVIPEFHRK